MKKAISNTFVCVLLHGVCFSQGASTTALYAAALDTVARLVLPRIDGQPSILVRCEDRYKKNITTYHGQNQVALLKSLPEAADTLAGKTLRLFTLAPLQVSQGQVLVQVGTEFLSFQSKRKWTFSEAGSRFYYVLFRLQNFGGKGFRVSSVSEGATCPNTTE